MSRHYYNEKLDVTYLPHVATCVKCAETLPDKEGWWYEVRGRMVWCCNGCLAVPTKGEGQF